MFRSNIRAAGLVLAFASSIATAADMSSTPALTPRSAREVKTTCDAQLAAATKARAKFEAIPASADWRTRLRAYDDAYARLSDPASDSYILHATHPDASVRKAADDCIARASGAQTAFGLSRAAYERLLAVENADIPDSLRHMLSRQLLNFRRNGVDRDAATRERIARLQDEITALGTEFERNISDDMRSIEVKPAELVGLPSDFIKLYPVQPNGLIELPVNPATFSPITRYANDRALRERLTREFLSRAYPANDAVLKRLLAARAELAATLGYATYADYDLADKMAGSPRKARAFLDDLATAAKPTGRRDAARMIARLQRDDPAIASLQVSDSWYASAKILKEEYDVDPALVRRYLRYDKVQAGIFQLTEDLFGVSIRPWRTAVWSPAVQAFEMVENGRVIGRFYLDMHPRDGKYTHAEMAPIRSGVKDRTIPVAALITNFPQGKMEIQDAATFLHEFGHLLHWLFAGQVEYAAQNFSEIESDTTEAPSQMLEEWIYDHDTLRRFATDDDGTPIPPELVARLNASREFGLAFRQLADMGFAAVSLDFHAHDMTKRDLTTAFIQSRQTYSLTELPEGSHMQDSFGHLAGYGASYYTYAWSKALAWDWLSRFRAEGMRNRATAKSYRDAILAPGGSESMNVLARRFLGRDWSADAWRTKLGSDTDSPAQTTASDKPPAAPVRPVTDDYFGTKIVDDYRYFEDKDNADAKAWMKAQAEHTRARLDALPGRAALLKRLEELDKSKPVRVYGLQIVGGQYYTLRIPNGAQSEKLYVRDGIDGKDRLLVDAEKIAGKDGAHVTINHYTPSPDNRYVAYGLAEGGSEMPTLHILDLRTGKDLPETIDRSLASVVAWLPDSRAFLYTRMQKLEAGMPATARYENSRIWLHEIGTDVGKDRVVVGTGISDARIPLEPGEFPIPMTAPGSAHVLVWIAPGTESRRRVYVADLDDLRKDGGMPWRAVAADYADGIVSADLDETQETAALHGDTLYALSYKHSPNGEVLAIDLTTPDLTKARVVVPAGDWPIINLSAGRDALWLLRMDGGVQRTQRLGYAADAKPETVELPFAASVSALVADAGGGDAVFGVTSWVRAKTYLHYDARRRSVRETALLPAGPLDKATDLRVEEVKVKARDGVDVPLTIIRHKDAALDGSHPLHLFGYGAYGISITPAYDPMQRALSERGVILAIAHVRGGGEYGEPWHRAGMGPTKPNTWRDFIDCAQYLVDRRYTSPRKLAIGGGSAGGILIGRAIEERPDLFAVAVNDVPVADLLRSELTANGQTNVGEFGSVKTEPGFRTLLAMSSYAHIRNGVKYPAVLVTTGINDPRVDSWEPAKFAARLQAATGSDKPVLLRVDYDGGHGLDGTTAQKFGEAADRMAFVLWQTGDPAFQPESTHP